MVKVDGKVNIDDNLFLGKVSCIVWENSKSVVLCNAGLCEFPLSIVALIMKNNGANSNLKALHMSW